MDLLICYLLIHVLGKYYRTKVGDEVVILLSEHRVHSGAKELLNSIILTQFLRLQD